MSRNRYPRSLIALHWLTLLLVALVYVCMEFRGIFPRGSESRALMKAVHYSSGLTVLAMVLVRIVLRVRAAIPAVMPALPPIQRFAATAAHLALYGFMLSMPLIGWLILSAEGDSISMWGLPVPALIGPHKGFADLLKDLHEIGASFGYALIGLHALAALHHHYIRRDDTLRRMLPGARG